MNQDLVMVVGSLNREAPYFESARGPGLAVFGFDPVTGDAEWLCEDRRVDNPTFLAVDQHRRCIYATTEVFGWHEGVVSAYRFDRAGPRLQYINKQPSLGSITAHCGFDRDGRYLLVANYGMGPAEDLPGRAIAVFPIGPDDGLLPATASLVHRGGLGPNAERQERPHPHCVLASPDNRFVVVADLGLDALLSYRFGSDGRLSDQPAAITPMPPGAGPRHLAFHPSGDLAVVICELDSTLSSLRYHAGDGRFELLSTVSAVPAEARHDTHCADVQIHPNGRFVYGSNRGHDSVVILGLDPATGDLTLVGHEPCGGRTPRNLAIDPSGRFLMVANQNSDRVSVFAIDPAHGTLAHRSDIGIGSPMCVKFLAL
jgi:6-phosphogluconolactonase